MKKNPVRIARVKEGRVRDGRDEWMEQLYNTNLGYRYFEVAPAEFGCDDDCYTVIPPSGVHMSEEVMGIKADALEFID